MVLSKNKEEKTNIVSNGDIKVDHSLTVNATVTGQIETKNQEVKSIVDDQLNQLKTRLLALEAAQNGKQFVPRPPNSKNILA